MHSNVMIVFLEKRIICSHPAFFILQRYWHCLLVSIQIQKTNRSDWSSQAFILLRYLFLTHTMARFIISHCIF